MTEKDLKKLNRQELLEVLLAQSKKIDRLQKQLKEANEKLAERELQISEAGSIAQASLVLNHIFVDAQKAADQYLENIRLMHERAKAEFGADAAETAEEAMPDLPEESPDESVLSSDTAVESSEEAEAAIEAAQADRMAAAAARAAAESDRQSAAEYLARIERLQAQTEMECAEKKLRADKQIRVSLIRTKKAVYKMLNLYADEVARRMRRLHEWDRQMEALHERKNSKKSSQSQ